MNVFLLGTICSVLYRMYVVSYRRRYSILSVPSTDFLVAIRCTGGTQFVRTVHSTTSYTSHKIKIKVRGN